jgi:hypothetical protein
VSENHQPHDPETGIQAEPPAARPETAIQAHPPPAGSGLEMTAFLARMRTLLQMHTDLGAGIREPPMWAAVQMGALVLAVGLAFGTHQSLTASKADPTLAAVSFCLVFFLVLFAPSGLLRLARRVRQSAARQALLDFIALTVRTYPQEVEESGGVQVLADRVELQALVQVLEGKYQR